MSVALARLVRTELQNSANAATNAVCESKIGLQELVRALPMVEAGIAPSNQTNTP